MRVEEVGEREERMGWEEEEGEEAGEGEGVRELRWTFFFRLILF